jgi:hypothetical protein
MIRFPLVSLVLLAALGASAAASAQHNNMAPLVAPVDSNNPGAPLTATQAAPGYHDRNCVQDTGSLVPAKKGTCLNVTGRSYNQEDLQRTGALTTRGQLLKLDPSLSAGH